MMPTGAADEEGFRREAKSSARRAIVNLAVRHGTAVIWRPAFRGSRMVVQDVEPVAGLRAARDVEVGARQVIRDYIRAAREAGHSWSYIGSVMRLTDRGEAAGEAAF